MIQYVDYIEFAGSNDFVGRDDKAVFLEFGEDHAVLHWSALGFASHDGNTQDVHDWCDTNDLVLSTVDLIPGAYHIHLPSKAEQVMFMMRWL